MLDSCKAQVQNSAKKFPNFLCRNNANLAVSAYITHTLCSLMLSSVSRKQVNLHWMTIKLMKFPCLFTTHSYLFNCILFLPLSVHACLKRDFCIYYPPTYLNLQPGDVVFYWCYYLLFKNDTDFVFFLIRKMGINYCS